MTLPELETYFKKAELPQEPVTLDECTVISTPQTFVQTHLQALQGNPQNKTFLPYYSRLLKFYKLLNK